jgi:hypothetical protein
MTCMHIGIASLSVVVSKLITSHRDTYVPDHDKTDVSLRLEVVGHGDLIIPCGMWDGLDSYSHTVLQ